MLDVFAFSQLAGPISIRQLPGDVLRDIVIINVYGDLLDTRLWLAILADLVRIHLERSDPTIQAVAARSPGRPVITSHSDQARIPKLACIVNRPGYAVISIIRLAGDAPLTCFKSRKI